jgi:hypothetical protein
MATLKELDNWGVMDALDTYGTLDQLDNLTLHQPDGSVSVAVTSDSTLQRVLHFEADLTGAAGLNVSGTAEFVVRMLGSSNVQITVTAGQVVTFSAGGLLNIVMSTDLAARILGEDWTDSAIGTETWTDAVTGSELWTVQPSDNEVWLQQ